MPEVLGDPPSPRTAVFWNGTAWQWALVDAAGHLQIDVFSTVMDAAAATAANQALILAQLQLIEDMRDALQSVATDRLIVRGEDQLFSLDSVVARSNTGAISGAGGFIDSPAVPAGEYWIITTAYAADFTSPCTEIMIRNRHDLADFRISAERRAFAIGDAHVWSGHTVLDGLDVIRATFAGALAGDTVSIHITGYQMTGEP